MDCKGKKVGVRSCDTFFFLPPQQKQRRKKKSQKVKKSKEKSRSRVFSSLQTVAGGAPLGSNIISNRLSMYIYISHPSPDASAVQIKATSPRICRSQASSSQAHRPTSAPRATGSNWQGSHLQTDRSPRHPCSPSPVWRWRCRCPRRLRPTRHTPTGLRRGPAAAPRRLRQQCGRQSFARRR